MSPKYTVIGLIDDGILSVAAIVRGDVSRSVTDQHDPGQFVYPLRARSAHAARLQAEHVVDQVLHGDESGYRVEHRYPAAGHLAPEMYA